ncbi:MAG: hypothetical protein AAGI68_02710 [Planctomycetota bacterium]
MGLTTTAHRLGGVFVALIAALLLAGCHAPRLATPTDQVLTGQYSEAAEFVRRQVVDDKGSRRYVLTRMRVGVMELAAGEPERAEGSLAEVYDLLRTQGINDDKTVATVVVNEGVRVWKGEPFEQALAMTYFGLTEGVLGSWDNVRAAAQSSLFYLRDFGQSEPSRYRQRARVAGSVGVGVGVGGGRSGVRVGSVTSLDLVKRAARAEERGEPDYLDNGYVAEASNFTLGYLLHGIASQQLGRDDEARDFLDRAVWLNPALGPLRDRLWNEPYNAVLVASYGLAPRKQAYGPSGALARFVPVFGSTPARLRVEVDGKRQDESHVVTDVNRLAVDHRWNNLEDLRLAKATLGRAGILVGSVVASRGFSRNNDTAGLVGLGILALGAYMEYQAQANTDYCDVFPQRFYVVPLWLDPEDGAASGGSTVELQVGNRPGASARLDGVRGAAAGQPAKLIYFRVPAYNGNGSVSAQDPRRIASWQGRVGWD